MNALKASIEQEEGCNHAKGMYRGEPFWYNLVTLTCDPEMTSQSQKVKNACDPSKRSMERPELKNDHCNIVTLIHRPKVFKRL